MNNKYQIHRHGLRNPIMIEKVESCKWISRNKGKHYILHDHSKIDTAKFSKPKFQPLFQATQKRTTAESEKLSSKHKKSIARKSSNQEIMFQKVHNFARCGHAESE